MDLISLERGFIMERPEYLRHYSRLLQLGAQPSGKAIVHSGFERGRVGLSVWNSTSSTVKVQLSPLDIVRALARDEEVAEGLPVTINTLTSVQN